MKQPRVPGVRSFLTAAFLAWTAVLVASAGARASEEIPDWVSRDLVAQAKDRFPDRPILGVLSERQVEVDGPDRKTVRERQVFLVSEGSGEDVSSLGCDESADIHLKKLVGWRVDPGGRVERFDKPILAQTPGGELYRDRTTRTVVISGIAPGALIAWERSYEVRSPFGFKSDYFRSRTGHPLLRWDYRLRLPKGWKAEGVWYDPVAGTTTPAEPEKTTDRDTWTWSGQLFDLPKEPEPYMPSDESTAPVFHVRYGPEGQLGASGWKEIADWYAPFSQSALMDIEVMRPLASKLTEGVHDPASRMRAVCDWIQRSVGYIQIYVGDGYWRPHPAKDVYRNLYGDCKDMAHLTMALLRLAGIRAHPVMANVEGGSSVCPSFPSALSFDHMIVAIESPGRSEGLLFFDPTARSIPLGRIGYWLEGTWAFVSAAPWDSALVRLPTLPSQANLRTLTVEIDLRPDLGALARVREVHRGQSAFLLRTLLLQTTEKERLDLLLGSIRRRFATSEVSQMHFSALEEQSDSLVVEYEMTVPRFAETAGDLLLLQPDFVSARTAPLFKSKDRKRDIAFRFPYRVETHLTLRLPDNCTTVEVPPDASVENDFGAYRRSYHVRPGTVLMERVEEVAHARTPADQYDSVKLWDRTCMEADRTRLILRVR